MAGIMANSATVTMASGDTTADNTKAGYIAKEQVTLTVTGTNTAFEWTLSKPTASGAACALNDDDATSVNFTPDVEGYYVITCEVNGTTTYILRISVASVANVSTITAMRMIPVASATVPIPATGVTLYDRTTGTDTLAAKDSAGTSLAFALVRSGVSASRPVLTSYDAGASYFDSTFTKPIWWTGTSWVDSAGSAA